MEGKQHRTFYCSGWLQAHSGMGRQACLPEAFNDRVLLRVATGVVDMRPHVDKVQALMIAASYQSL